MPITLTPAQQQRAEAAIGDALAARENGYRELSPTEEFRAELGRQMMEHGLEKALETETDTDIATRMHIAGYSPVEIAEAVQEGSLQATGEYEVCGEGIEPSVYGATVATYVTSHEEVRDATRDMAVIKRDRGLADTRRLDRLDMATETNRFQRQSFEQVPAQRHEQELDISL